MRSKASLAAHMNRRILEAQETTIQENSATALVRLTGLAIICLNQQGGRCEIGVIRDTKHQLTIDVRQAGGTIASYKNLPKHDVRVEIKAQGAPVAGYQVYQQGAFDRQAANDPKDFRWLVDMQSLHGGILGATSGKGCHPLTKIYIDSGLLYTHELDQNLFFNKFTKTGNIVTSSSQPYGKVAKTMGVQIDGSQVGLSVQIGANPPQTHVLQSISNQPSIIDIKNIDYSSGATYSDMADYYMYVASPGNQVELVPGPKPGLIAGKVVNQENFCHPVVFPLPSIDQL
ncbi:MAG TPA: hypothetical protein VJT15_06390 [Pyrinomonadaceae bacterium]|nr:hypothetical protein [Pyrinomonadaceae bacterium]